LQLVNDEDQLIIMPFLDNPKLYPEMRRFLQVSKENSLNEFRKDIRK